ncbi:hypothetical protein SAMN02745163_04262 [Clostridium cavendishii DSM 21758]|uniref:CAAX prenyl protease 2/Lysostaphin resistance protein A-like domain-containing protein n=1 Tax=Clostridium cavendishii DSM 21758 TaxID=1121302 RepID=A0A1M6UG65_9CLOT|nr:type II CAAX endopeptidase family protein [Clostridium cavendishii]SHK68169.1 hypothetical protein SAMN02745163_04262 [Clostridium cavendishii DSM 21758]
MKGEYLKRNEFLLLSIVLLVFIIIVNSMANFFGGWLQYLFYQGGYGLLLSLIIPLIYVFKYEKADLKELGFKKLDLKGIIIASVFIVFSVGGQLKTKHFEMVSINQMIYLTIPLVMTTFFEEFLFRGFFQTRYEKIFGTIPAIILSGLTFSLYHLGYPSFRSLSMLSTLFLVGMMFALAFKLSGNNLLIAFLVNLPNAILTYLINPQNFTFLGLEAASISLITIIFVVIIVFRVRHKYLKKDYEKNI